MGHLRDMLAWEPLTMEQNKRLESLTPDRKPGMEAAVAYLDRTNLIRLQPGVLVPIAVILVLFGLMGLCGWIVR